METMPLNDLCMSLPPPPPLPSTYLFGSGRKATQEMRKGRAGRRVGKKAHAQVHVSMIGLWSVRMLFLPFFSHSSLQDDFPRWRVL